MLTFPLLVLPVLEYICYITMHYLLFLFLFLLEYPDLLHREVFALIAPLREHCVALSPAVPVFAAIGRRKG